MYESLKEYSEMFLEAFHAAWKEVDITSEESCTYVSYSMKSDHPLVLLRQQYLLYCKTLINWDVFLEQALSNVSNLQISPNIDSPLKTNSHKEVTEVYCEGGMPSLSEPSAILSETMVKQLLDKLPNYLKYRDWDLIYSTDKNGWSLNTFYRNCENYGSNILIIRDENHYVFGGFASQSWVHCRRYYGNGECFLFSFDNTQQLKCYFATLENEFYMCSDSQCLMMGGG